MYVGAVVVPMVENGKRTTRTDVLEPSPTSKGRGMKLK